MQNETQNQNGGTGKPRLLDQIRQKCRLLHYSIRTEEAYIGWVVRFLRFHRRPDGTWRHPSELTGPEIGRFLTHLATDGRVSASTQNQALCAIVFMYKQLNEVRSILDLCPESSLVRLLIELMYGTGMRLLEVCRLRIKDVDFDRKQIMVRDGKGEKDRAVPLPEKCIAALRLQIEKTVRLHQSDLDQGFGDVHLPYAIDRSAPTSHSRKHGSEARSLCCSQIKYSQKNQLPYLSPQFCDSSA